MKEAAQKEKERRNSGGFDGRRRSGDKTGGVAEITKASSLKVNAGKAAFGSESLQDAFKRYDVDDSGYLDFGEVSVALADMGCLEGVLASKAGELFDDFDVDGDGQVDFDEFEELARRVKELKGTVNSRPAPEVPAGFAESAAALALRKSFEAFAGYGSGGNAGMEADAVTGRDWAKLVKDCGLIGGSVNKGEFLLIIVWAIWLFLVIFGCFGYFGYFGYRIRMGNSTDVLFCLQLRAISSLPEPPGGGRGRYGGKTGRSSRRARTSPRSTG
tara:strand:- start:4 stop:819 length:816 start_codon:yes stop_codon:yes gene_type:complete